MAKISQLPALVDSTGAETVVVLSGDRTQRARFDQLLEPQVRRADMLLQAALAAASYYTTRVAGEAGTGPGGLFSTGDGDGNIVFFERLVAGSAEIARTIAPATQAKRVVRHLSEFGVVPNAGYSQTAAIIRAFTDAANDNAIVMTRQGEVYRHDEPFTLPDGVVWQMNRATLLATDPVGIGLFIGSDTHIMGGGHFQSPNAQARRAELHASRIIALGARWTLEDVEVDGAASVGIMKFGCSFGRLIRPVVRNTEADGIHTTYGANNNTTVDPLVEYAGDDCLAYVAYSGDGRTIDNELLIGGRGRYSHARGLTAIGVRNFTSTNWSAEGCRAAGVYTGGELASSVEANNSYGTSNVLIDSPVIINCCTDTSLGHAPIMVFGRDGTNPDVTGAQISRAALSTRIIHPTVGGGNGAAEVVRVGYGAENTQVVMLKARDVLNPDRKPSLVTVNGHNTTLVQPEGIAIGGNGIVVGPLATGFVIVDRPIMSQMGVDRPDAYRAFFACDPAARITRMDITGGVITTSAGLQDLFSGVFPDGVVRLLGTTVDGVPVVEKDSIAERYIGGNHFDFTMAGSPRPRPIAIAADQVATYQFSARVQARLEIVATAHGDQNLKLFADEIFFYDAADTTGEEGVDYIRLPGGGYYCRRLLGAGYTNVGVARRLILVNGQPALTIGAIAPIDITVRGTLNRKEG